MRAKAIIARSAITPHKTRTGKVYRRLSSVFAHKLPRRSQQLPPPTPSSNKCFNEPLIVKPLKESSRENVIKPAESSPFVSDAGVTKSADIITFVSEEEINQSIINVPNLEDILEPKALISFNSTMNESHVSTNDTVTDKIEEPSVLEAVAEAEDPSFAKDVIDKTKEPHIIGATEIVHLVDENEAVENDKCYLENEKAVEKDDAAVENQLGERTLISLPKLPDISCTSSAPRKQATPSPESSPIIPRMDPVKIYKQFKGFNPLVFEQPSASSSKESFEPEKLKEKNGVEDLCFFEETKKEDADVEFSKKSPELYNSPVQLPHIPEVTSEMPSTTTGFDPSSADINDKKSYSNGRRSRRFNLDEFNSKTENIANSENRCPSPNITRRKQKVNKSTKQNDTVLPTQPAEIKSNRSRRNSIFPRQAIKTIEEKGGLDSDLCQTSSSSPPNSLNDSVICLSPVRPSSSSVSSSSLHGQQTTDPPTQYEPPPKKNRGRTNKKSPVKKSPQKLSPAEGDESQTASNGVELIDGKVYATIKKAGKKGIPLKVEVDSSLLVDPKESCLKKPKNESWNGEKRFRWADWTKDKELTDIREFESDEKYSFRKSTKEKRFVDPYGD